ncbi:acyl-CoA dehydrogenase [Streptomyces murinus]|uniref:acyl-CoA dehydrogenase family protein n=1 Tax=Streptomyces murinus TaxID=33900 RepID=UPI000A1E2710|nr:acyl-CoA dehydrogenase [Streptomyces murinus]WDO09729.1 acyl-CoA dehydrogenase [Streptomyces murinus]
MTRRLRVLREYVRAEAPALRGAARAPDGEPLRAPLLDRLATLQIPRAYARAPLVLDGEEYFILSAVERVVFHEEAAAYGDAAALLSAPGSLTAGMLVAALGDDEQQSAFFGRLHERPTWTFLAMTEPGGGSDATRLDTTLAPAGSSFVLNGEKRYVGNAHRAETGVVTARTRPGPLGIRCVLVDTRAPGFSAAPIPTLGMRGALGAMRFTDLAVPEEALLGRHLPATRRGMWGWLHAFNPLRCVAAALGVGLARATHLYVAAQLAGQAAARRRGLAELEARIAGVRSLTMAAARAVDADPGNAHLPAAAKTAAAGLAVGATTTALRLLGPGARLEHPLLDRWARDAHGIEHMEGTSHIQRMAVSQALARGRFSPA